MSVDLLRRAAKMLRSGVAALPVPVQAAWEADGAEIYAGPERSWVAESLTEAPDEGIWVSAYIVTMQPSVALALASVFDRFAWLGRLDLDLHRRVGCDEVIALARAVLREPEVAP
jgi:hypothetical protein